MRRSSLRTVKSFVLWSLPALLLCASTARALTAEEILQLRDAGVSDDTIQDMLQNERCLLYTSPSPRD